MNPFEQLVVIDNSTSPGPKTFVINDHKILYNKESIQSLFTIAVRSDVTHILIMDLIDQVLLSLGGGMVTKHGSLDLTNKNTASSSNELSYMEINTTKASESVWSSIKVFLGVNMDKQRVVCGLMTSSKMNHSQLQQQLAYSTQAAARYGTDMVSHLNSVVQQGIAQNSVVSNAFNLLSVLPTSTGAGSAKGDVTNDPSLNLSADPFGPNGALAGTTPSVDALLRLPQTSFHECFSVISRLFCLSLFEEYLTDAFTGVYLNNRKTAWLQQFITNAGGGALTQTQPQQLPISGGVDCADGNYRRYDDDVINDADEGDQRASMIAVPGTDNGATSRRTVSTDGGSRGASTIGYGSGGAQGGDAAVTITDYFSSGVVNDYHHCAVAPPEVLKSLLDVCFVKDFQRNFAYDMRDTLLCAGEALDNCVAQLEYSCARLMTTLKLIYSRSGIHRPNPPEARLLSDYPLVLPSHIPSPGSPSEPGISLSSVKPTGEFSSAGVSVSILDASLELSSLLIYKARKHQMNLAEKFRHIVSDSGPGTCAQFTYAAATGTEYELLRMSTHIKDIVHSVYTQLQAWAREEAVARMNRKLDAVTERVTEIEEYKYQLLLTLHERTGSALGANVLQREDKEAMAAFKQKFRFVDETEEPVLFECPVWVAGRSGTLYVTAGHLCYHSNYSMLADEAIFVIPWTLVQSLQFGSNVRVHACKTTDESMGLSHYVTGAGAEESDDSDSGSGSGTKPTGAVAVPTPSNSGNSSSNQITIVDTGGSSTLITVTGSTPDFCSRVYDFLVLLFQTRLYAKILNTGTDSGGIINNEPASPASRRDRHTRKNAYVTARMRDIAMDNLRVKLHASGAATATSAVPASASPARNRQHMRREFLPNAILRFLEERNAEDRATAEAAEETDGVFRPDPAEVEAYLESQKSAAPAVGPQEVHDLLGMGSDDYPVDQTSSSVGVGVSAVGTANEEGSYQASGFTFMPGSVPTTDAIPASASAPAPVLGGAPVEVESLLEFDTAETPVFQHGPIISTVDTDVVDMFAGLDLAPVPAPNPGLVPAPVPQMSQKDRMAAKLAALRQKSNKPK